MLQQTVTPAAQRYSMWRETMWRETLEKLKPASRKKMAARLAKRFCRPVHVCLWLVALATSSIAHANERLKVGYNIWVGTAAVFIAQEKGYFKEAGLDVELVPFKGPGDTMPPLIGGHLDVALTTADNVVLMNSRTDSSIKIIFATDTSNGADAVIAGKTIATLADLKGKTVAVTQGEVNELLLLKALESVGLTMSDINSLNMDPDSAGAAFIAGKVDAAVSWEPWISQTIANGGKVLFSSAQVPNLILGVATVTPGTLATKAKAMDAFLGAVDRGADLLKTVPDEAIPLAAKWLEVDASQVKEMLVGVNVYDKTENATLFGSGAATRTLDSVSTFFLSRGAISKTVSGSESVEDRFLLDN